MGKLDGDFSRSHGWTNFTMCFTEEVVYIMKNLNNGSLGVCFKFVFNYFLINFKIILSIKFYIN